MEHSSGRLPRAVAALLLALLLAGCGRAARPVVPAAAPPAPASASVASTTAGAGTTDRPIALAPTATSVPPAPTATSTPDAAATAAAQANAVASATRGAREAQAIDHLGAGNTLRQAGILDGALHEYATAKALAPERSDVAQAMGTAQAMATAQAAPTPVPVLPVRLQIPKIGVDAPIENIGVTPSGALDVPQGWWDVGWYKYGPVPGQLGNAVIDGHLDSTTGPAVFWRLGNLGSGDHFQVLLSSGEKEDFVIQQLASYPYDNAPLDHIFGPASSANLNLITCGGSWDPFQHNYSNRTVVYSHKS